MTLKEAIAAKGLTQRKLEALSGVSLRQISKICTGEVEIGNITARNYIKLCDALSLEPHVLLGGTIYAVYAHRPGEDAEPDDLSQALLTYERPDMAEDAARTLFDDVDVDEAMVVTFLDGTAQPRPLRLRRLGDDLEVVRLPRA